VANQFATATAYKTAILSPKILASPIWTMNAISLTQTPLNSLWMTGTKFGGTPTAPSTAVVCNAATPGALDTALTDTLTQWLAQMELRSSNNNGGVLILCDRLSHQGGLSGTVTTAQTTNLPTAALTRYTTGAGVMAGLEIYAAVGSTSTTVTMSYTNQSGASGQTSQTVAIGATGQNAAFRFLPMTLASGDSGVQAVASVTLTGTTGTAGNFGVTLYKPLALFPIDAGQAASNALGGPNFWDALYNGCGNLPEIVSNACLFWLWHSFQALGVSAAFSAAPVIALA
jgi:hypothetical protein